MADNDFWSSIRNSYNNWFTPQPQQVGGPGPGMVSTESGGYQPSNMSVGESAPAPASGGGGYGDAFKSLGSGAAQLGAYALINKLFPSTPNRVISPDTRTEQGTAAENLRLQNAGSASGALSNARAGKLDPYMEQQVRRRSRSADAARGMLETGGSAGRETNAVQEELNRVLNREAGNVSNMTSGYAQRPAMSMPGHENPWAKVITAALMPGIGQAGKTGAGALSNWFI